MALIPNPLNLLTETPAQLLDRGKGLLSSWLPAPFAQTLNQVLAQPRVMMALGDFRFSVDTAAFVELERTSSWRWEAVDRIGQRPALQYLGPGDETIRMPGVIYPAYRGGLGQVDQMRALADQGKPLQLVDGTGRFWGDFVITDIRDLRTVLFSDGTPRRIDFEISLRNYGADK